mgnify:CR=1 FL=1|tara:strand:- start:6568 stop:8397 length:1830 start_codon:yes stop_codon:yes gene_type:complete
MAEKRFIIEVRTKGFSRATRDFDKLDKSSSNFDKTQRRMRRSSTGLAGSIGALRNSILVYTFAIGGALSAMGRFINASSQFEMVKVRLVGLTGGVIQARRAFDQFNKIAATTPFTLNDVVNAGAQLEAFGLESENTLKATTDLAAFMGTTATEAASALGRAFAGGAGAADILRERGILQLIKDSQGITDLTKITLPEFREALLNSLQDPVAGISGSTDRLSRTFVGAFSNMQDSLTRLSAEIGDVVLPSIKSIVISIGDIGDAITDSLARLTETEAEQLLRRMKELGVEANALSALEISVIQEETQDRFSDINDEIKNLVARNEDLQIMAEKFGLLENFAVNFAGRGGRIISGEFNFALEEAQALMESLIAQNQGLVQQSLPELTAAFLSGKDGQLEQLDVLSEDIIERSKFIALLKEQINLFLQSEAAIAFLNSEQSNATSVIAANNNNINQTSTSSKNAAASINIFANAISKLRNNSMDASQTFGFLLSTIGQFVALSGNAVGGAGLGLLSGFFAHTGGLITNRGIQRFANGGVVQGQDNVPIMAQAGEFVMRREAVQNIGVQNLAQMNRTGDAGGVTVNISAPLVDETVIDHIIPAINKATNRNLA